MATRGIKLMRCLAVAALVLPVAAFAEDNAGGALAHCKASPAVQQARGQAVTRLLLQCMSARGFVLDTSLPIGKRGTCDLTIYPEESAECYRRKSG
jgi:hypothetical protein